MLGAARWNGRRARTMEVPVAVRTLATSLATTVVLGVGAVAALALPGAAQADPTTPPGPAAKSVTVCLTGPDGSPFLFNRVVARSADPGVYRLRSVTQTRSTPGGCGTVAVGSTGEVGLRAVHVSKKKVRPHVCVRSVYRASWPTMQASTITDGSTLNGQLKLVSKRVGRC